MKNLKFMALLMTAGLGFVMTACDHDDVDPAPQPEPQELTCTFEGEYFARLIDNPQIFGPQLYGDGTYNWKCPVTSINSKLTNSWGDGKFWGGGIAISNYVSADLEACHGEEYQLTVPVSNGSNQFAVVYCTGLLQFASEGSRPQTICICPTNYLLYSITKGDGTAKALDSEGDYLTLHITADNGKQVDVDLARDGSILSHWSDVDLTSLGLVHSLTFTMSGSDVSDGWINSPAYVAIDDITVLQ